MHYKGNHRCPRYPHCGSILEFINAFEKDIETVPLQKIVAVRQRAIVQTAHTSFKAEIFCCSSDYLLQIKRSTSCVT